MIPKIKNILYASDLSPNSVPALSWAMMLAHQHDARITFLHVNEEASKHTEIAIQSFLGEEQWNEMTEKWYSEANTQIHERISQFCDDAMHDMDACPTLVDNVVVTRNNPVEGILEAAAKRQSDLIVMGTHGAGIFKDAMIGSTARRVLRRSKIPVFVIPLTES